MNKKVDVHAEMLKGIDSLCRNKPNLRQAIGTQGMHHISGEININHLIDDKGLLVVDKFDLDIHLSADRTPVVFETGRRLPETDPDWHKFKNGACCLGSPLRLCLHWREQRDINSFFYRFIEPYFIAQAARLQGLDNGYIFGALEHDSNGLVQDYAALFGVPDSQNAVQQCLRALSLPAKRIKKSPCPCGCGQRFTQCEKTWATLQAISRQISRKEAAAMMNRISNPSTKR